MSSAISAQPGVFRERYPCFADAIYLNSCSLGALSLRARERVNEYLDLWQRYGASAWYEIWWASLAELRQRYGSIIGAGPGEMAIHANISSLLSVVASSLDYSARNRVVVTNLDFPTIAYQWLARERSGLEVVILESEDGVTVSPEQFERAVDERTAIVATSHVFFSTGAIQNAKAITAIAHRYGALALIDGYQAAGQVPVDVRDIGCDFYCGGGLKWLMGGSGIAYLYTSPELIPEMYPEATGWFAHREQFDFDTRHFEPSETGRRMELGTPSVGAVYAQLGGLEALEELGVHEARRITSELAEDLIAMAVDRGITPRVAPAPEERSAIVMLPHDDPKRAVSRLADAGFIVDSRPGHVRVSPWFYNVADDHRALIELLSD